MPTPQISPPAVAPSFVPYPDPHLIRYVAGPPGEFAQLTAATLGGAATGADGFDSAFAATASTLGSTAALHQAADAALSDTASAADAIDTSQLEQLAQQVSGDTADLNNLNTAYQTAVAAGAAPPALPATPGDVSLPDFQIPGGLITPPVVESLVTSGSDIVGDLKTILSGLGTFARSLVGLVETALLAVPIYGWVIAGIGAVVGLLWHGADPNQVPAAKTEQVFELAADGFYRLAQNYYLDLPTFGALVASLIAQGAKREQALESQFGEARPFQNGISNMTNVIQDLYVAAQRRPNGPTRRLDLTVATQIWDAQSKVGWYPDSAAAARQIYFSAVNSIIGRQ